MLVFIFHTIIIWQELSALINMIVTNKKWVHAFPAAFSTYYAPPTQYATKEELRN